jgi:hypothetical protein
MSTKPARDVLLSDLKEGDVILSKFCPMPRLAIVTAITRDGKLKIRRKWNSGNTWGHEVEISVTDVLKVEARI